MGLIIYILRAHIEQSKYPIFNVCPMYFFTDIPDKFENLNAFVVENEFFTDKQKKVYMELFAIAQKHYYSFSKLARIWKTRKLSYYNNDVDLCLKPLDSFPESQKITLLHFKKRYIFRLTDLMNIWMRALTKNTGFKPRPHYPFNPYINRPFRKHHLYNIYLKLLDSKFMIPPLIQHFFKLNMNLTKFELQNYPILKDYAIDYYLKEADEITLFLDVIHMVETFKIELEYAYIDSRMPDETVKEIVTIMKPYLRDFFIGLLSCNPLKKELSRSAALNGLRCFFQRFPRFGTLRYHNVATPTSSSAGSIEDDEEEDIEMSDIDEL
jgi:hypothetical protein